MKFKKITAVLLCLSLACGAMMTGCGKKTAQEESPAEAAESVEEASEEPADEPDAEGTEETKEDPAGISAEEPDPENVSSESVYYSDYLKVDFVRRNETYRNESGGNESTDYFKLELGEEDAARYPKLKQSLDELNAMKEKEVTASMEDMKENNEGSDNSLSDTNEGYVLRADNQILSVLDYRYTYFGGAHPDYLYYGYNYDTESGKRLALADVISDKDRFISAVQAKFADGFGDMLSELDKDPEAFLSAKDFADADAVAWTMDSEGITVYFNVYELGNYAQGSQRVTLFFDENAGLINDKYTKVPSSYVIPLESNDAYVDIDGDGVRDYIRVETVYDEEYQYYNQWVVHVGEWSTEINNYGFGEDAYLVKANDQYYLYIFESCEDDYRILSTVDLKKLTYDPDKEIGADLASYDNSWGYDDESSYNEYVQTNLIDPTSFDMQSRLYLMSTVTEFRNYHVGSEGYAESSDPFYMVKTTVALTTLADVDCQITDAEGNVTGQGTIPKGTALSFIRSDGATWVDFQEIDASRVTTTEYGYSYTEDYTKEDTSKPYYRITLDGTDYPERSQIGGVEESELFAGIMYAG